MQVLSQRLPTNRASPRLWFERLVIFREPDAAQYIRTIRFQRGLNLIWAKEPAPDTAKGTRAAGHGVGKTSLCLLLRLCLGDTAKMVADLREELYAEFPHGGVVAVLYMDDKPFILCRYFNAHKEGSALMGNDIDQLWQGENEQTYKAFEQQLSDTMMSCVVPRVIPETGQTIEWRHVLAWLTRDQGSRFKSFFAWREGEGTGLQRSRQDPPIVMRAILGLLEQSESDLMAHLSLLEQSLIAARQETASLKQEPSLIRLRIESELRAWKGAPHDLPIHSDDLFNNSVEREIRLAEEEAVGKVAALDAEYEVVQRELVNLRADSKLLEQQYENAKVEYELADAARRKDEVAYKEISGKLLKLKNLSDWCEHGNIAFQRCQHIRNEVDRLQAPDLKDGRDTKALVRAMSETASQAGAALARMQGLGSQLQELLRQDKQQDWKCRTIRMARDSAAVDADRGRHLMTELRRWEHLAGSNEAQAEIDQSMAKCAQIEREIGSVKISLVTFQAERSAREKYLSDITDYLAKELLPDGAFGIFDPRDETRPFRLSMHGGEAYRVLEVLLGDMACMLDSGGDNSAFPGFVIHDCPREADMSSGLYENFLLLAERLQSERYGEHVPYQYIVTTTTPPPAACCDERYLRLELDPSRDDGLLFRKRLG